MLSPDELIIVCNISFVFQVHFESCLSTHAESGGVFRNFSRFETKSEASKLYEIMSKCISKVCYQLSKGFRV